VLHAYLTTPMANADGEFVSQPLLPSSKQCRNSGRSGKGNGYDEIAVVLVVVVVAGASGVL